MPNEADEDEDEEQIKSDQINTNTTLSKLRKYAT